MSVIEIVLNPSAPFFGAGEVHLGAVAVGLMAHMYFKRNEPALLRSVGGLLCATGIIWALATFGVGLSLVQAAVVTLRLEGLFFTSLFGSMLIYRNSPWHPLAAFPGPALARNSSLWWFIQNWHNRPRLSLQAAHAKYGDFVRIAPNELSINNVEAIPKIHSLKWQKSISYSQGLLGSAPEPHLASLQALRSRQSRSSIDLNLTGQANDFFCLLSDALHSQRRKVWDPAFSSRALVGYHPFLLARTQQLMSRLTENQNKVTDLHTWNGYFVYDVMSDLAYGGGFDLLKSGKDEQKLLPMIVLGNSLHGLVDAATWIKAIFTLLPASEGFTNVIRFTRSLFEQRYTKGSTGDKDVFSYLIGENDDKFGITKLNHEQLAQESQLIVGAGSDTTRAAITLGVMYLTRHQDILVRLQREIDDNFGEDAITIPPLEKLPLLNAVINESLRLLPPIVNGAKREAPSGGAEVCGQFIPGGTPCRTPNYVTQRDERYFSPGPQEFRPDRWINPQNEIAFNKAAFFPFQVGAYACIGKQVALQELRIVFAEIASRFDIHFAPNFDLEEYERHIYDRFVAEFGLPLNVLLSPRAKATAV